MSLLVLRCAEPIKTTVGVDGFLELKKYENGPDPVKEIERTNCQAENNIANACLSVREALVTYFNNGIASENNDWPALYTSENLAGKSSVTTQWVELFFDNNVNAYPGVEIFCHKVCNIFPVCNNVEHEFHIVKFDGKQFIVDLSIRQFINGKLALNEEEAIVFDALLKNGFVEIREGVLDIYYSFFESYSKHKKRWDRHLNNFKEWYLYDSKMPKSCVKELCF